MRVLYTRGPLLGSVIRRFSAAPVDHCGLLIGGLVWDVAMLSPVQPRTLEDWLSMRGRRLVFDIEVPLADEAAGELAVMERKGIGYDYLGPLLIPFQVDGEDPGRDYCTELVNHYVRRAEPALLPPRRGRWDMGASVGMVYPLAQARGGSIVYYPPGGSPAVQLVERRTGGGGEEAASALRRTGGGAEEGPKNA